MDLHFQKGLSKIFFVLVSGWITQAGAADPKVTTTGLAGIGKVLPIFQKSCLPCHAPEASTKVVFPKEGSRSKAKKEMAKAQADFEMGSSFPFPNDEKPKKQLLLLERELRRKEMPPDSQKELGIGEPLSEADRQALMEWIEQEKVVYR